MSGDGAPRAIRGSLLAAAGQKNIPLAAALRGGREPSLASVVAHGCSLTMLCFRILEDTRTPFLDTKESGLFQVFSLN